MGTYIFSIKCSHWLQVSQILAWKRVRSWAAGMGWGWRKEQAGTTISEGNDPTPSLLCSRSASRFWTLRAGGGRPRTPGHAGPSSRRPLPGPGSSAPTLPCRRSPEKGRSGDLAWLLGANLGHGTFAFAAPIDVGAELGVQKWDPKPPPSPA